MDLWSVQGAFQKKKTNSKNWGFCVEKKGKGKIQMAKVVKSCHQVTWHKKARPKRESEFLISKSLSMNS